ncbi:MAG: alpha-L-fucosidase [Planctomycetes bacterium]|jgi:alpha-L-fucosidase|nr:alpha-L-fucosidase [Planctomycetota bacterium]
MSKSIVLWVGLVLPWSVAAAQEGAAPVPHDAAKRHEARIAWWRQARFGMFLHWGPVSLTGLEISWSRANSNPKCPNKGPTPTEVYDHLYERFNPVQFDAREWVATARAGGMKYLVLTAKHCDGFLLWHSQADEYNIANTPFRRDVCGELAQAAREEGMRLGWYFSPMDWRDPDFRTERNAAFLGRMQQEVQELLRHYGRIDLLWFDWDGREPLYDQIRTYALVRKWQPDIVINNRLDLGTGHRNTEIRSPDADYYTPEQQIGRYDDRRSWETCMTLGTQWSWKPNDKIKSVPEVIHILARVVGGDGNLLLNVGPMPDGRIEPAQADVLRLVGAWLRDNGESIYGTRGGPFQPTPALVSTRKANVVYIHLLKWTNETVTLPALPKKIVQSQLLTGDAVPVVQTDSGITLTVPRPPGPRADTIVKLTLDGPAQDIPPLDVTGPGLIRPNMRATASNVYHSDPVYGPGKAIDGADNTRWATDGGTKQAWLEVDLGQPATFDSVEIDEAYAGRVRSFELQYEEGGRWRPFYQGTTLGEQCAARFAPVTARRVRLYVLDSNDGPTITEFQLFEGKK